jgi:putative membrane protein
MKSLRLALSGLLFTAPTSPVFAQQQCGETSGPPYGYGHMMWYGPGTWGGGWGWDGWHSGYFLGPLFMLLALIGIVLLVVWLARITLHGGSVHGFHSGFGLGACPTCGRRGHGLALEILAERFARGEIDKDEFDEKRKLLGS